jgi:hypothetical protein
MECLADDLFKPLTKTESKRLVGGLMPLGSCLQANSNDGTASYIPD